MSLHPGVVRTELTRYIGDSLLSIFPFVFNLVAPFYAIFTKSCEEGAQTTIHCAVSDDIVQYNGCYFRYSIRKKKIYYFVLLIEL